MAACAAVAALPAEARGATAGADRPPPPKLPLAQWWSVALDGQVGTGPVSDGTRVYVAFSSGQLAARDAADGHEVWRVKKDVSAPMAAGGGLVFVVGGDAVEAIKADAGASAWVLPRVAPAAPLLLDSDILFVTTETEVIAVRAATGEVIWRHAAGGVRLRPSVDAGRVYVGAQDGRVLALNRADGAMLWERFFPGGVTAMGAGHGLVYIGAGDKFLYCLQGAKKGANEWQRRLGGYAVGRVGVDDEHVYLAGMDNVVMALDRKNGNQRWTAGLRQRPVFGVFFAGHVVFIPANASQIAMIYDHDGRLSGTLTLPGDLPPGIMPALLESPDGAVVYAVTGSVTNEWLLTRFAPAGDTALLPLSAMEPLGLPFLTDPALSPLVNVLTTLVAGDPLLQPVSAMGWPVVLRDPPLMPLTELPGLQLRALSPVLPVRRAAPAPGG